MIIDMIVILNVIKSFNSIDYGGVQIRYPCSNTDSVRRIPRIIIRTPYIPL